MPLNEIFHPHVQRMPPPIGPTLIRLVMQEGMLQEDFQDTIQLFEIIAPFIQELCS
jgi:hypothetical protein